MIATAERFSGLVERHRREIHVHCYRMVGSFDEAEDLVQETLLRAWRSRADLEREEHLRAWLYAIATHACLDAVKAKGRRVPSLASIRDLPWLEPYPDRLLDQAEPLDAEPGAALVGRETIELTFLAVIQLLPPRQRAVLILREVLDWPAAEVAALLDIGIVAVNSSLQRARSTLRRRLPPDRREGWSAPRASEEEQRVLRGFIGAHESGDMEAALALLSDDIRVTMPPAPYLFEGREAVAGLVKRARDTGTWRLIPTGANRQPAAASYLRRPGGTEFTAFKIDVLRVVDGTVAEITTFGVKHFAAFGLPARLD